MPARALTPAEEKAALMAFAMLKDKKLIKVSTGRGRKPGMAPVHAALAIRKGAFAKRGAVNLSADSQLFAAATAYGLPPKKIKEYLDLLVQCEAAAAAAVEAAEEAAVKAAVEAGKEVRLEAATAAELQGKPFAKCSWREGIRQLEDALQAREAYRAGLTKT